MRYIYDNDLHIHSQISLCSADAEQTNERILQYARENNLSTICLTDHFWDENVSWEKNYSMEFYRIQNYRHIAQAKPLPQENGISFLFGCETDIDKNMTLGISPEAFDKFDFVVIPTTHFHMKGFTIPETTVSVAQKVNFWLTKLNAVLDMSLPFYKIGIAHLTCGLIDSDRNTFLNIISSLPKKALYEAFTKAAERGVGIELNSDDMNFKPEECEIVLRPYRIAKKCGCKFYMGSDAHHPHELDAAKDIFERAIDLLELKEVDKFKIKK